ncbi:MAG: DUF4123 domain-containing protein [Acidobacteria bacterium]|nr:DUF4123 domain-containing protein [Acidobacteriota bacterium]
MPKIVEALGGHLFGEAGLSPFAVLDGASAPDLLDKLDTLRPEYACLYRGALKPDMAEVAPYLVRLEQGVEFTRWVLEEGWGKHCGIFALAAVNLIEMRRHFRTMVIVDDPEGDPLLFRFYDPRVLRVYLPTCEPREVAAMFGPVTSYLLEDEDPSTLLRFQASAGKLVQQKRPLALQES